MSKWITYREHTSIFEWYMGRRGSRNKTPKRRRVKTMLKYSNANICFMSM